MLKKTIGKGKIFHFHEQFELGLAEKSLKDEMIWSKIGTKKYLKVSKSYQQAHRCNRVRYRKKKRCCAGCLIISPANTTKVEVHRTICAHDHIDRILGVSIGRSQHARALSI